jgi:hypothetical protein
MDTWTRKDGRHFSAWIERDLYGLVVITSFGGRLRPARFRSIPVSSIEEGERTLHEIAKRRMAHGYVVAHDS